MNRKRTFSLALVVLTSCTLLFLFQNCQPQLAPPAAVAISTTTDQVNRPNDPFFGIHKDILWESGVSGSDDRKEVIARLRELNVGSIRVSIRWLVVQQPGANCLESELTPHAYNMGLYRTMLNEIPSDIEVLAILDTPPQACVDLFVSNPAEFSRSYANYIRQVVTAFKDRVHEWELWNEPNNNYFYMVGPHSSVGWTAADFTTYVLAPGYAAIRTADPQAKIIGGSFAYNGVIGHQALAPQPFKPFQDQLVPFYLRPDFLVEMLDTTQQLAGNPTAFYDALSLHPYHKGADINNGNTDVLPNAQTYGIDGSVEKLKDAGVQTFPLYWTEFGTSVYEAVTEARHAQELTTLFQEAFRARNDARFPLKKAYWFSLRDYNDADTLGFGLISKNTGKPKAAFYVYKDLIAANSRIRSVIDRFDIQNTGKKYSSVLWRSSCSQLSGVDCESLFWYQNGTNIINMSLASAVSSKTALISKGIDVSGRNSVALKLKANMLRVNGGSNDDHSVEIGLGPWGALIDSRSLGAGSVVLTLRRRMNESLMVNLITTDARNIASSLYSGQASCSTPEWNSMIPVEITVRRNGTWGLVIKGASGATCLSVSGSNHKLDFSNEVALRMLGQATRPMNSYFRFTGVDLSSY